MEKSIKAVIYARVSSKEQGETGYSLEAQEQLLKDAAVQKGFEVAKVYKVAESASGKSTRKVFMEMLEYATKNGVLVILCEKIDRLTRNLKDAALASDWVLAQAGREIHFVKESFVVNKNTRAHENLMWDMKVAMARFYTNNLSEEVKKGQMAKLAARHYPSRAPLGYKTVGEQGKKVQVIDPDKAFLVKEMFELYATGNYSVVQLTKEMHRRGLRNLAGGKLSKSRVHDHLTDPFYYGDMMWKGNLYKGSHEPLITLETFNKVQNLLGRKMASPYFSVHHLRYKGKTKCGECGRTVSWEIQRGKVYGSCKHCKAQLASVKKYILQSELDELVISKVREVAPVNSELLGILNQALLEDSKEEVNLYQNRRRHLNQTIQNGDVRVQVAYEDRLVGRITPERFDAIKAVWDTERKQYESDLARLSDDKSQYYDAGMAIHRLATRTEEIFRHEHVTDEDRRLLMSYAFTELKIKRGELEATYTPAFEFLVKWVPLLNESFEQQKVLVKQGLSDTAGIKSEDLLPR